MAKYSKFHPLLAGVGFRLSVAAVVISTLWIGYFIAIAPPGGT